jgi:hypothetical protein
LEQFGRLGVDWGGVHQSPRCSDSGNAFGRTSTPCFGSGGCRWLRKAVVNGCCSRRRWVGVRRRVAVPPISAQASSPDVADDGLAVALQRLSKPHRVVLALRYFGDLTGAEIASDDRRPPTAGISTRRKLVLGRRTADADPCAATLPLRHHISQCWRPTGWQGCACAESVPPHRDPPPGRNAAPACTPSRQHLRRRQTRRRPLRGPLSALLRTARESLPSLDRSAEPAASAPTRTAQ